ncbi:uncharacterized protein [Aegilops tauschii subsp. strangulata]|uniref:uncharacterized protein n=1 Tax=Aegilops tauschii subsp. strangulata TaxID=200361 RepID=UPI00098A0BB8|nr:uncharacterized protein LOC109760315 [Aegilops tauschii subsp. strangulata]
MSGGVGPTAGGIALPSMGQPPPPQHPEPTSPTARPHHHYYLFSCKHLNTLGAKAVLAFSTTVPLSEIAFAVLLLRYLLLATLAFPQHPGKPNPSLPVFLGLARLLLAAHTVGGFLVGVALPALYVLNGLRSEDTTGIAAAAPHVFLLSAQVFIEGLTAAVPWRFSLPVRAAVPVMYSARRMFVAGEWLRQEMEGVTAATGREGGRAVGGWAGRGVPLWRRRRRKPSAHRTTILAAAIG